MQCPSCATAVEEGAWFCPVCAHQLHDDVAAPVVVPSSPGDTARDATFVDEVSRTIAWADTPQATAEALIVGEVSEESGPAQTYHGAVAQSDGSTPSFRLYAADGGQRIDDPTIAPQRTSQAPGDDLTPYEQFVYEEIDGRRTLGEIQSAGLLAPTEIQVSLLTLIERGLVSLTPAPAPAPLPTLDPSFLVELPRAGLPMAQPRAVAADRLPEPTPARLFEPARPPAPPAPAPPAPLPPLPPPSGPPLTRTRASLPAPTATVTRARASDPPAPPKRAHDAPPLGAREVRLEKARTLYAAAMVDRAASNVVSARMNLKLAIALDPENGKYQDAFAQLGQVQLTPPLSEGVAHPAAQKTYDEACAAEAAGDLARAVRLLEAALEHADDPVIMNRLGVVLAMKRGDWKRGHQLLLRAVELAPMNPVYTHNLSKIVGLAAARDGGRAPPPKAKGGFWKRLFSR